ncbi:filaggrin [Drosophila elegans]|uniref:filaggrin n=1 Tax=Drosophila elegans TaxID=30023 RepID=UPI0007E695B4|nr:filaggrin [Drosophila elegans]
MFTYRQKLMILLGQLLLLGIQSYPLEEDLSASVVHSAGLLGHYAGGLTGGEALSKLDFSSSSHELGASAEADHLGSLGDHLGEEGFPADYGSSDAGEEYAEASEVHSHYEDLDQKAVPGIDHGKGAFSYSTLYEFKDREEHELHHMQHQALEEQVEHQHQAEHQHDHHLDLDHHQLEHLY